MADLAYHEEEDLGPAEHCAGDRRPLLLSA